VSGPPRLELSVTGAGPVAHAAAPTMRFRLEARDDSGRQVYTVALGAQIHLEPAKRRYSDDEIARLGDLFGSRERWPATTRPFLWSRVEVLVPSFTGSTGFDLLVPCTYDHEVAGTKYLASLDGGEVPVAFHFSGTVMYRADGGGLQIVQVPWEASASYALPVDAWRTMIDGHYPNSGWVRLHADTLAELRRQAAERGLPSLEACVQELLAERGRVP
jgi:hypothetical protein